MINDFNPKLECDKEPSISHKPYYEIFNNGEDKLFITKTCHEHQDWSEIAIEINPYKRIKIKCENLSLEIAKNE